MTDYEICGATKRDGSGEPCKRPAGWGTDHAGDGRCKLHGGNAGAPEGNQNGTKHGLNADPLYYYQSLSPEEEEWVEKVASTIKDRVRENTGLVDHTDRVLSRQVAIELHIHSKALNHISNESGLMQDVGSRREAAPLLKEVRQYGNSIMQNLNKLGVLEDSESRDVGEWRGFIENSGEFGEGE